ncbi:MAG: hypothetical protein ACOYN0_16000 [Phycisphaerales bacterium]
MPRGSRLCRLGLKARSAGASTDYATKPLQYRTPPAGGARVRLIRQKADATWQPAPPAGSQSPLRGRED